MMRQQVRRGRHRVVCVISGGEKRWRFDNGKLVHSVLVGADVRVHADGFSVGTYYLDAKKAGAR
jgi:hypothetical protein